MKSVTKESQSVNRILVLFLIVVLIILILPKLLRKGEEKMQITSTAFTESNMIPAKYTCDGRDISPPLEWKGIPAGTKSLALINDDPDAPVGTWVHWVIYNIPPNVTN